MAHSDDGINLSKLVARADEGGGGETIKRALQVIRTHLGMEVAYVSEFVGDKSVFQHVDAPSFEDLIKPGDSMSLDDVYCRHILEGRLPELIPDTSAEPVAMALPITTQVPIGKHMSVPIRLNDGSTYGMFCCLGRETNRSLNERDLQMMRAFADLAAFEINREHESKRETEEKFARIKAVIEAEGLSIVYQPIWHLAQHRPLGLECLSRFSSEPRRTPDLWFKEAAETGLGPDLELAAVRIALSAFDALPKDPYLAVNVSPASILSNDFMNVLSPYPLERIVIEITEHAHVVDYDKLRSVLQPLRERGVRLAVDDAGAGYASLQHILQLRPDIIKLDMELTRHIDLDPARRALATALIMFAKDTGSKLIAEGVETASELNTLKSLGVEKAQGYFLGRPVARDGAVELFGGLPKRGERVA